MTNLNRFDGFSGLRKATASLMIVGAMTLAAGAANAANVIVDFSGFSEGQVLNGAFNFGGGVTGTITTSDFNPSKSTGEAMVFDTTGGRSIINDPDLAGPFQDVNNLNDPLTGFGNALILQEINSPFLSDGVTPRGPDDVASGGRITFTFDSVVSLTRIFILDGNDNSPTGASLFLDGSTTALATNLGGGDNQFELFEFLPGNNVSQLTVDFAGSGAIGQFGFAAIPVPASLPLLLTGLGAVAWVARRRRKAAV